MHVEHTIVTGRGPVARIVRTVRILGLTLAVGLTGCHSAYIDSTITNATPQPVSLIQVDYPSASFGTQILGPGQNFHYRFKILGNGPVQLTYTDAAQHEHKFTGPLLREGNEGKLTALITAKTVQWTPQFTSVNR